jgi:hypothetical protein
LKAYQGNDIYEGARLIYKDKAFVSTSLEKGTAFDFVEQFDDGEGIVAVIKAKEGTNCANISAINDFEKEILLGRDHTYKITKAWVEDGLKHIEVKVINRHAKLFLIEYLMIFSTIGLFTINL